ncbi:MAG TPA: zinc ribbon domain-containing protein, partial [Bradyrhizobium sp.]|nr:zinc ribbon domain-containing protein [Bradyrhizobium sp.]
MECLTCKTDLPDGSKFCNQCGSPQLLACQACGHGNAASAKFCTDCGAILTFDALTAAAAIGQAPSSVQPGAASERRQLSVMFCDLVGSVSLAERLDPEDFNDVLATYLRQATTIIEAGGGLVARYLGDGILAYFGYPAA